MKTLLFTFYFLLITSFLFAQNYEVIKACKLKSKCTMQPDYSSGNYTSIKIKKGKIVKVLNIDEAQYVVQYNGKIGFVHELHILDTELMELRKQKEQEAIEFQKEIEKQKYENKKQQEKLTREKKALAAKEKKEREEKRNKRMIEKHGDYKGQLIIDKQLRIGWDEADALESWGAPTTTNVTTSMYGSRAQWVYRDKNHKTKYLYFESGKLTTIQQ